MYTVKYVTEPEISYKFVFRNKSNPRLDSYFMGENDLFSEFWVCTSGCVTCSGFTLGSRIDCVSQPHTQAIVCYSVIGKYVNFRSGFRTPPPSECGCSEGFVEIYSECL